MWLTGVFGIATKYGEAVLSVKYRVTNAKGEMAGGPMFVLERGMNARWLGVVFAGLTAVAGFGIGNMTQANAIVTRLLLSFMRDYVVAPWSLLPWPLNCPACWKSAVAPSFLVGHSMRL